MKNRVLAAAAALAAMGGAILEGKGSGPYSLDQIASEPRSTMWHGFARTQRSKRTVAQDKRDARKKRNRERS